MERWRDLAALGVAMVPYALLSRALWWSCDDAFISYRYGRHLAQGEGLRFNLGEPAVEGFSNLAWVWLAALAEGSGLGAPTVVPWVSLLIGGVGLFGLFAALRGPLGASRQAATAAVVLVGSAGPYAVWATSGLETMAVTVLISALLWVRGMRGAAPASGLLAAALTATRVEGLGWVLLTQLASWASTRRVDPPMRAALAGAGLAWLAIEIWRMNTFGDWVPNTVHVKLGAGPLLWGRGLAYVALALMVMPTVAAAASASPSHPEARPYVLTAAGVAAWCAFVGGDYLPFFRFLVPTIPLLAVPAALWLDRQTPARATTATLIALLLGLAPLVPVHVVPSPLLAMAREVVGTKAIRFQPEVVAWRRERDRSRFRRAKARILATEVLEPGASIVARGVGALGYETDLVVLDPYGLVSAEAAEQAEPVLRAPGHDRRVSRGFFLERDPDVVFAIGLTGRHKSEVIDALPRQWGLFEDVGDGRVYVAQLHTVTTEQGPAVPTHLLLVRPLRDDREPAALREAFKDSVREAGYRPPKLLPLDERRRAVALEKRTGGDALMEVLWGPGGKPRR